MSFAVARMIDSTWAGVIPGRWLMMSAARPATCGDAIDVPWKPNTEKSLNTGAGDV